jgi:hypothetical protein
MMRAFICLLLPLFIKASFLSNLFGGKTSQEDEVLLPKVLPHNDKSYLISFESDDYDHCKQMQPVLKRLEEDLGTAIRRINIMRKREFMGLLEAVGHNDCGTLPFYYNRRTGQAICGATSYSNLRKWGTGDLRHSFNDPPESLTQVEDQQIGPSSRRGVGTKGLLLEKMQGLEKRGKTRAERMNKLEAIRKAKLEEKTKEQTKRKTK